MKTKSIIAALGLAIIATAAHAQSTFNKFQPANGVQCNTGSTYVDTLCTSSQIPAGGSSGTLQFKDLSTGNLNGNSSTVVASDGGLVLGSATGGSQGPGTLNAPALYINGAPVGTSSGAVSSVALALPSSLFIVTGSPVTAAGTLTGSLQTQLANQVWAGPTTGSAATPAFRALVAADIPTIPAAGVSGLATVATTGAYSDLTGTPTIPTGASPSATFGVNLTGANGSATTFLRSDAVLKLDPAIAPNWTGMHLFTGAFNNAATSAMGVSVGVNSSIEPTLALFDDTQAANNRSWAVYSLAGSFGIQALNDAASVSAQLLNATRTATAITGVTLGNTTDLPAIALDGTTTIKNGGGGAPLTIGVSTDTSNQLGISTKGAGGSSSLVLNANGTEAWEFINNQSGSTTLGVPTGAGGVGNVAGQPFYFGGMPVNIKSPSAGVSLTVNGVNSNFASIIKSGTGTGVANGVLIEGGTNSSDNAFYVQDSTGTNNYFRVVGNGQVLLSAPSGAPFTIGQTIGGSTLFQVQNSGSVGMPGLGTSTAAQTGYLCWSSSGGSLTVDSTNTCLVSSARYKKNVRSLDLGLDAVMKLRPITYEYKDGFMPDKFNPGRQEGFIAEEVQKVDPRLTPLDSEGKPKSVEYAQMTALLTRAIQDQQQEIWELKLALGALAVVSLTWLSALTWKRRRG